MSETCRHLDVELYKGCTECAREDERRRLLVLPGDFRFMCGACYANMPGYCSGIKCQVANDATASAVARVRAEYEIKLARLLPNACKESR